MNFMNNKYEIFIAGRAAHIESGIAYGLGKNVMQYR